MNQFIEQQKRVKKAFGVSISPNMKTPELVEAWSRVPSSVKVQYPEISLAISALQSLEGITKTLKTTTEQSAALLKTAKEVLDSVTSGVYTQGAVTTAQASLTIASEAQEVQSQLLEEAVESTISSILKA